MECANLDQTQIAADNLSHHVKAGGRYFEDHLH